MPVYRVALCEDEAVERRQIAALCRDIFAAQGVEAEIVSFSSADALRQAAEESGLPLTCIFWTSKWRAPLA